MTNMKGNCFRHWERTVSPSVKHSVMARNVHLFKRFASQFCVVLNTSTFYFVRFPPFRLFFAPLLQHNVLSVFPSNCPIYETLPKHIWTITNRESKQPNEGERERRQRLNWSGPYFCAFNSNYSAHYHFKESLWLARSGEQQKRMKINERRQISCNLCIMWSENNCLFEDDDQFAGIFFVLFSISCFVCTDIWPHHQSLLITQRTSNKRDVMMHAILFGALFALALFSLIDVIIALRCHGKMLFILFRLKIL